MLSRLVHCGFLAGLISGCAHSTPVPGAAPNPPAGETPAVAQLDPPRPGGAIVTSDDLQRTPTEPIEKILQAKVAGVWVTRTPDGGLAIRIRGTTTVSGNTAPLYVIDDVPIQPGPNGALAGINPYDIASIEVVKDVTGTAMYGIRGANGVIIIKTKRLASQ